MPAEMPAGAKGMPAIISAGARRQAAHGYAGGVKYYYFTVGNKRHLRKTLRELRRLSIDTAIPVGLELPRGLRLPEEQPERLIHIAAGNRSVAGQSAAVTAPRMSKTLERVLGAILPFTKTLALDCGPDTERAARYIHRHYGVAVLRALPDAAGLTVDLTGMTVNGESLLGAEFTLRDAPEPPFGADRRLWNLALLESGLFEVDKLPLYNV